MPNDKSISKIEKLSKEAEKALSEGRISIEKGIVGRQEKKEKIEISGARQERVQEEGQIEKISPVGALPGLSSFVIQQREQQKRVEKILEQGLDELYLSLPKDKQLEFKRAGEETAAKIVNLLNQAKVKVKKIIVLIIKWLSVIPGVNKFFLEQEAKIKADELLKLRRQ